jgi:hypothetical protein
MEDVPGSDAAEYTEEETGTLEEPTDNPPLEDPAATEIVTDPGAVEIIEDSWTLEDAPEFEALSCDDAALWTLEATRRDEVSPRLVLAAAPLLEPDAEAEAEADSIEDPGTLAVPLLGAEDLLAEDSAGKKLEPAPTLALADVEVSKLVLAAPLLWIDKELDEAAPDEVPLKLELAAAPLLEAEADTEYVEVPETLDTPLLKADDSIAEEAASEEPASKLELALLVGIDDEEAPKMPVLATPPLGIDEKLGEAIGEELPP